LADAAGVVGDDVSARGADALVRARRRAVLVVVAQRVLGMGIAGRGGGEVSGVGGRVGVRFVGCRERGHLLI
jgi:hypothetical protein